MRTIIRFLLLTAAVGFAVLGPADQARALVLLPYTNNFDGDTPGPVSNDPNFVASSTYSVTGNSLSIVSPGIGGSGNGLVSVIGATTSTIYNAATVQAIIPSSSPMTLSMDFRIETTNTSGVSHVGLAAYGNRPDLGVVGAGSTQGTFIWPYLLVTGSSAGSLSWVNFLNGSGNNNGVTLNGQVGSNLPINTNDVYTFMLTASYDASGDLMATVTVTNRSTLAGVLSSETITAATNALRYGSGSYFGTCDRANSGDAGTQTILHDNFSLSSTLTSNYLVAEPKTCGGWTLAFSDEFEGSALDTTKWATTYMWSGNGARTLSGNSEMEVYWDNQFVETNGVLRICADKLDSVWYGATYHYASGMIDTYQKFSEQYGYFEMRARCPHGDGLWPAFWLLDNTPVWPPEIDILEILDSYEDQPHAGAIQNSSGAYFSQFYPTFNATTAFHVYSLEWDPVHLTYYLDGQEIGQTSVPTNAPAPMQLIANLAVGGTGTIPPNGTTVFPAYLDIDYIRAWTRTDAQAPIPYTVGTDIGTVGLPGATSVNTNGTALVTGAGAGYLAGGTNDGFQYAAQPMPGDVDYDYLVEVSSMSAPDGQAGVMIRRVFDPASEYTAFYLCNGNCILQSRTNFGEPAFQTASVPAAASTNLWLRLLRRGDAFTAYQSVDGILWSYVAAVSNDMSATMMGPSWFAGAAVSSGSTSQSNLVAFGSLNKPAVQVIKDNADSTGVIVTGPWVTSSVSSGGTAGYYGPNYLSDNKANKGQCSVEFIPTLPNTASYDIYLRWIASSHAASNVPVSITYAGGSAQVTANQQHEGGEWVYLGTYPFNAGASGNVVISNPIQTSGYGVIADAVRFVPGVSTPAAAPDPPAVPTGLIGTSSPDRTQVSLSWNPAARATSYNVYRSATSGGPYTMVGSGVLTSSPYFTDSNVVAGAKYFYVVTAVNNTSPGAPAGQESGYSNEAAELPDIVVDNADSSGVAITGSWITNTTTSGYFGINYLQDGDAGGGKSVRFSPNLSVAGSYDVYLRWTSETNRASNVPVDVISSGGTNTFSLNQQVSDGVWWVCLGTFNFAAGTAGSVVVRDDGANGYVVADATQFVWSNPQSVGMTRLGASSIFTIQSLVGRQYQLQRSPTLSPPAWQAVGSAQAGTGGVLSFTDSGATGGTEFYRIQVVPSI